MFLKTDEILCEATHHPWPATTIFVFENTLTMNTKFTFVSPLDDVPPLTPQCVEEIMKIKLTFTNENTVGVPVNESKSVFCSSSNYYF